MHYLEKLPDNCPIDKAVERDIDVAYRVVPIEKPDIDCFISNAALGVPLTPITDPCRHASCSLFISKDKAIEISKKLPKARFPKTYLSMCTIKAGFGKSYINKKKHVDFWPYRYFDPATVVIKTELV